MYATQAHDERIPSAARVALRIAVAGNIAFFWGIAFFLGTAFFWAGNAPAAESVTATATATISGGGSVGDVTPTPTPATTTSTSATTPGSTVNTSTTNGGGSKSQATSVEQSGVTTFRPLPSVGPAATGESGEGGEGGGTEDTTTSGGPAAGPAGQTAAGPRLPQGARPIANLTGGLSSVAVTGTPNQTYGISLPGQTTIVQGSQTVNIQGFVHNAGDTPAMDRSGRSSFNVGAKVSAEGGGQSGGTETGGAATGEGSGAAGTGAVPADFQGPVITTDPFMDVIISYN